MMLGVWDSVVNPGKISEKVLWQIIMFFQYKTDVPVSKKTRSLNMPKFEKLEQSEYSC